MKRHGDLWPTLTSFEHLLRSSEKAKRGKRFRPAAVRFEFALERELWKLREHLLGKTYRPGQYRSFYIYEPKKRLISAAPYRDRIVHHALTGMLEPIFEPTFISDSYACRKGKAREQIEQFLTGLRLKLHPRKNTIFPVQEGIRFLGYRVFPTHRLLVKENVWRFLRRVRRMQKDFSDGKTTLPEIKQRLMSWTGHAGQADTHRLRSHLFGKITFQRATAE
jgi:hypothetical protein